MRIIAAADIHGIHEVYDWLVERAGIHSPDAIVLAGDLLGWGDAGSTVKDG
jgi:Icc-related predicted phosphoesterase